MKKLQNLYVDEKEKLCENDNKKHIDNIKIYGINWVEKMLKSKQKYTEPGSISHLLNGKKPSEQSINIKMGHFGEYLSKELIKINKNLELLNCGIQKMVDGTKNDVDLIFKNEIKKTIYYRELKGNISLDSEKLPATIDKCKKIENSLKILYPDYTINYGILNWSVYNRKTLKAGLSNIKTFEDRGIKIDHMESFLEIINVIWCEEDFYIYFREIGTKINTYFIKYNI